MENNLFDNAVLLKLEMRSLGLRKKVSTDAVECDADKSMIGVSKAILDSPKYDVIRKHDADTRKWVATRSLPSMFQSGIYLWPIVKVTDADEYLTARNQERNALVEDFCADLPTIYAEAQEKLGSLYNPKEYPDAVTVSDKFSLSYSFLECSAPKSLAKISPELFKKEQEKAAGQWRNAIEEAQSMLYVQLDDLVSHMSERLQPSEDGTPKKFKNTIITNFQEFFEIFPALNTITNNSELAALVDKCKATMQGCTAKDLRDNEALRNSIKANMDTIKGQLASYVTTKGRSIDMDESEETTEAKIIDAPKPLMIDMDDL
jgi:hypothetical protein